MGPQGSGKSTQSKLLAKKLGLCVIDTGQMIRDRGEQGDAVAAQIKQALNKGDLVSNQIPADLLQQRLAKPDCQGGVIIDGYPRTLDQLAVFDPGYDAVVYLDIKDTEAVKRLIHRGRGDDTPEGIKRRLELFHLKTKGVLSHFQNLGKLIKVDGGQLPERILADIQERLNG